MVIDMCNDVKAEIKVQDPTVVGSWKQAINSANGVWLTRGKFSQNCSFTVKSYTNHCSSQHARKESLGSAHKKP